MKKISNLDYSQTTMVRDLKLLIMGKVSSVMSTDTLTIITYSYQIVCIYFINCSLYYITIN